MTLTDFRPDEGVPPSFLQYLLGKYMDSKPCSKDDAVEAHSRKAVSDFIEFSEVQLKGNRPTEISHAEANYCIKLMNGDQFLIAPTIDLTPGAMQESQSVPVTGSGSDRPKPIPPQ